MSNEREVWIASALVADMSVDLFAWRLEQDWDRIGAGRWLLPAKDDQRPEYARTWLLMANDGAMLRATQRTLSSIVVRFTGAEDLARSVHGWLVMELGAVAQVDQTLADLEAAVEEYAKAPRGNSGEVVKEAVAKLPAYLRLDLKELARHTGGTYKTTRNKFSGI